VFLEQIKFLLYDTCKFVAIIGGNCYQRVKIYLLVPCTSASLLTRFKIQRKILFQRFLQKRKQLRQIDFLYYVKPYTLYYGIVSRGRWRIKLYVRSYVLGKCKQPHVHQISFYVKHKWFGSVNMITKLNIHATLTHKFKRFLSINIILDIQVQKKA
jgi:hypothetical protein